MTDFCWNIFILWTVPVKVIFSQPKTPVAPWAVSGKLLLVALMLPPIHCQSHKWVFGHFRDLVTHFDGDCDCSAGTGGVLIASALMWKYTPLTHLLAKSLILLNIIKRYQQGEQRKWKNWRRSTMMMEVNGSAGHEKSRRAVSGSCQYSDNQSLGHRNFSKVTLLV